MNLPKKRKPKKPKDKALQVEAFGIERNKPKEKTRGVVIYALGHPYFSHMAFNLAVSIRYQDPGIKIALFHNGLSEYAEADKSVFDIVSEMPPNFYNGRFGQDYYKPKMHLPEFTPFDETIFLDTDILVSPDGHITELFEAMQGKELMFGNRGEIEIGAKQSVSQWCDLEEVKASYGIDKVYDISSEVIYFKNTDKVKKVFAKALQVYDEYKFNVKDFGSGKPDEAFLMVALALEKVKLTPCPFHPTYWQPFYFSKMHKREFVQSHFMLSVGGNRIQKHIKKIYDSWGNHFFNRSINYLRGLGSVKPFYQLMPKSRILKERSRI